MSVYDKDSGTWISKQDVGTTNFAEKEKSQASDSFKRACFNWGIGRELYTAPFIWIPADKIQIKKNGDKYYYNDSFSVSSIGYSEDREITELKIINGKGITVYELSAGKDGQEEDRQKIADGQEMPGNKEKLGKSLTRAQMNSLNAELERTGVTMEAVQKRYKIQAPETMSENNYNRIMAALARTKSAGAA